MIGYDPWHCPGWNDDAIVTNPPAEYCTVLIRFGGDDVSVEVRSMYPPAEVLEQEALQCLGWETK